MASNKATTDRAVYAAEPPKFFTVAEVARDHLHVSAELVRQLVARGELGHRRVGRLIRISSVDLHEFARRRSEGSKRPE